MKQYQQSSNQPKKVFFNKTWTFIVSIGVILGIIASVITIKKSTDKQTKVINPMFEQVNELEGENNRINNEFQILQDNDSISLKVFVILGLHIYPKDLGKFSNIPHSIIEQVNSLKMYDFNDWRMPTIEELELMSNNFDILNLSKDRYMSSKTSTFNTTVHPYCFDMEKRTSGTSYRDLELVRLVRTDK